MAEQSLRDRFEAAAAFLSAVVGKTDSSDLLYLYARFKQAKEGPNNKAKPSFFDFQGKQKWQAWKDLGDMSAAEAMEQYVAKMTELEPDWGEKETPPGDTPWVSVSVMKRTDQELLEGEKTVFDWVKENDLRRVRQAVEESNGAFNADVRDEDGLALIHWCADRGSAETLNVLLKAGADVNALDPDGQTALHYAASCGHVQVVKDLIEAGADLKIRDANEVNAEEAASDENTKDIFKALSK